MSAANNWPRVRLGDVCEVRAGADYKAVESPNGEFPIYGTGGEMGRANKSRCPANSVIVGRKGTLNNPLLIEEPFWNIDTCFGVIPSSSILPKYLFAFCQSFNFYSLIPASGRPSTTSTAVRGIELPLPPLTVQREIVARLEKELGQVDHLAKKFADLETAAEAEFKATLKETFDALGNGTDGTDGTNGTNGTDGTRRSVADVSVADVTDVSAVPSTATRWVRLGEVGRIVTGSTPAKMHAEYYGKDFPLFKPTDLNQGAQTTSASDSLSKQGWAVARQLPKDSVLVTCIGATLGKAGIIRREGSCNQQINAILCEKVFPEFAYYWIVSPAFQGLLWEGSHSTTLPIVNKSDFSKKPIPLPPLPTQRAIVARLDAAKARKEALVDAAKRGAAEAALWRKAILKEAFE